MNIEMISAKPSHFKLKKVEVINNIAIYNKLINWGIGEFDLYLKNESKKLKIYFPNGWFSISCFKNFENKDVIEIKVEGKSKVACDRFMMRLVNIYNYIFNLYSIKNKE